MTNDEEGALDRVVEDLVCDFPAVPAEQMRAAVSRVYAQFEGRPIRDYVPVLVRRIVRDQLRRQSGRPPLIPDSAGVVAAMPIS